MAESRDTTYNVANPRNDLTAEYVRAKYGFDNEAGRLTRNGRHIGWVHSSGYRYVTTDGHHYKEHRLIWLWLNGEWPSGQIDHVDGDKLNNRRSNLQDVSGSQNQHKISWNANNTTGFRGVIFHKGTQRFVAQIKIHRKINRLGYFKTAEEASAAYQAAVLARSTG